MPSEHLPYSPLASARCLVLLVCALAQLGCSQRVLVGRERIIDAGLETASNAEEDAGISPRRPVTPERPIDREDREEEDDDDDEQDGGDEDDSDGDDEDDQDDSDGDDDADAP